MSRNASPAPPPEAQSSVMAGRPSRTSSAGRLVGVDLARGLAVLGMFAAHVGPDPSEGGALGWGMEVARGRSAALFALLAGFTLVVLTGRPRARTGRAGRQAMGRVVIRSLSLIVLGYALTGLDTGVDVILACYGLLFVIALPLHRLRAATLAAVAAAGALVLPQVLYLLRAAVEYGSWGDAVIDRDPLAWATGSDGVVELFITGAYPVLTWLPFIVAGMAVGRLDLGRPGVVGRVGLLGGALAVLGYGGSWLALHLVPGALDGVGEASGSGASVAASAWWSDGVGEDPVAGVPAWLLVGSPHSQTTWPILGNTGVALVVLAVCLVAMERSAWLRRAAAPVVAVGSIALTAYVAHIVAIEALETDGMPVLLWFAVAAMLFALAWTRFFRRGPLEYVMHAAAKPAFLIN
ncbi:heparan-alpha-glucosaminide N-acetyltransferase domain-containing protein [Streptomyces sp. NPDC000410]|uniref:heparan-alpha-glucosaminide N-acetyltransferase domain-containing protein n=1 Tax=Streptomyces sp. NPDC000410 TaxID=3154254 RepID=UPI00331C3C5A